MNPIAMAGRRTRIALIAATITALALAGCSKGTEPTAQEPGAPTSFAAPVTITNCDRTATFDAPPQRIVSMNDHVTETLIQLGAGDRIVGMGYGERKDLLPETAEQFRQIPVLSAKYPTAEQILDLDPDLVVGGMSSAFADKDGRGRDALEAAGIATFLFSEYCGDGFTGMDMLDKDFGQLGEVLGTGEQATALVDRIHAELGELAATLAGIAPASTFFYDSGESEPFTVGGQGVGNVIAEYAGAQNITADVPKVFFTSSWELVGERAPDAVVVLEYDRNQDGQVKIDYLRNQPIAATTPAVRDGRFVIAPMDDFFESYRMVVTARTIAEGLHPEAFAGQK